MTASKTQPILKCTDINVGYDNIPVAENVSFEVYDKETFGLIGINGAGKTSLIKSIVGLREPLGGEVSLFGKKTLDRETKRDIGYLPERFDPPWFLTGEEFIKFSLTLYKRPYHKDVLVEYCRDIRLDPQCLDRRMTTYSKGMRQKLGLLATLMSGVRLIILDEPMSGLDPLARVSVKNLMKKAAQSGQTIFLSSHILSDLDELCDRIAVLHDKKIQFVGTPAVMKRKYKHDSLEKAFLHLIESQKENEKADQAA